ncbi:acyl-CoA dehydrogenase family protein [Spongiibacter nanhainus]|uniref:Acyl-CoA dehydrogenase family protein n=1 Tax=Spongiibacter nanhainus TaxID=2794344 RepID=A0A7T4UP78_9GAMM|nr:acyl-CoA dehydrogenase family protein [Spongiibacter nanhainus]QQD17317.1 acyl-CoA dehydrogenase family protein [Spongiibacter nanhainus]
MDLKYNATYEAFRQEVISFLDVHWPAPDSAGESRAEKEAWFRKQAIAAGYLYRGVPREFGGSEQEADILKATIIRDEFGKRRAPMEAPGIGNMMLVPTLLECGTQEQKERFIPKTLTGEYHWAQGYSEPNAGSDLAALRTRAELVEGENGMEWSINGQKIWSTLAQFAQYMFVLARTEPEAGKHAGISYLLIDLKNPGITIRPIKQVTGGKEFCEVFFDDARTPADWIVGERGEGWTVSKATLAHERSSIGGAQTAVGLFEKLIELAKGVQYQGVTAIEHPQIRERLVILEGYVQSHLYSSYRQLSMAAAKQNAGRIGLMNKLINTNIGHMVADIAKDLINDAALLMPPTRGRAEGDEKWLNQFFGSLGVAIAGGTSNIQRNIIAERGFGLPRDDAE